MIPAYYKRESLSYNYYGGTPIAFSYSTFVASTVSSHLRASLFDYVNSQNKTTPNTPFQFITWNSFGTFNFNTPVGTDALWAKQIPNCIYAPTSAYNRYIYASSNFTYSHYYSIMFRFRIDAVPGTGILQTLFNNGNFDTSRGTQICIGSNTATTAKISIFIGGNVTSPTLTALAINTWHHIALCGARGVNPKYYYLNGALLGGVSANDTAPSLLSTMTLFGQGGATGTGFAPFNGAITDFTYLNRVLTAEEVFAYYKSGFI